jgi:predicted transport protein
LEKLRIISVRIVLNDLLVAYKESKKILMTEPDQKKNRILLTVEETSLQRKRRNGKVLTEVHSFCRLSIN